MFHVPRVLSPESRSRAELAGTITTPAMKFPSIVRNTVLLAGLDNVPSSQVELCVYTRRVALLRRKLWPKKVSHASVNHCYMMTERAISSRRFRFLSPPPRGPYIFQISDNYSFTYTGCFRYVYVGRKWIKKKNFTRRIVLCLEVIVKFNQSIASIAWGERIFEFVYYTIYPTYRKHPARITLYTCKVQFYISLLYRSYVSSHKLKWNMAFCFLPFFCNCFRDVWKWCANVFENTLLPAV